MRLHRFYVNKPLGEELVVESAGKDKDIVHQWLRVFRFSEGNQVILFSPFNSGFDFLYTILSISKDAVRLSCVSTSPNVPAKPLTLCMALVKKDTFETVVRQATELGVSSIIPILAVRSEKKKVNSDRLETIAKEATEQSGRGTVPYIHPICTISDALSMDVGVSYVGSLRGTRIEKRNERAAVWIGPEGGWTEEEEKLFMEKGYHLVKYADTILKADTAACAFLSSFQ